MISHHLIRQFIIRLTLLISFNFSCQSHCHIGFTRFNSPYHPILAAHLLLNHQLLRNSIFSHLLLLSLQLIRYPSPCFKCLNFNRFQVIDQFNLAFLHLFYFLKLALFEAVQMKIWLAFALSLRFSVLGFLSPNALGWILMYLRRGLRRRRILCSALFSP